MGLERIPTHGEVACNAVCQVMMGRWCSRLPGEGAMLSKDVYVLL